MVALQARPLRFDATRIVVPLALLPGLAMAAAHAPVALLTVGPVVLTSWALARRDRFRLDRCAVHIEGPALELRYGGRRLDGVDLRYAARHQSGQEDLVLCEGDANYLAFGTDPPDSAYLKGDADAPGLWRAVRLRAADLSALRAAVAAVRPLPPPDPSDAPSLLQALGSVGIFGPRAEAQLLSQLAAERAGDRLGGLRAALQAASLEAGPAGAAARRVLGAAPR